MSNPLIQKYSSSLSDFKKFSGPAVEAKRYSISAPSLATAATKVVKASAASRLLGKVNPWVGAALGANELRKNVPKLVKGIPAYMKERKAAKESKANYIKLAARSDAAFRLRQAKPKLDKPKNWAPSPIIPKKTWIGGGQGNPGFDHTKWQ